MRSGGPIERKTAMKRTGRLNRESKKTRRLRPTAAAWRATFMERSGGACECCDAARATAIHHVYERSAYPHLKLHPANGCAVCTFCHDTAHADLPAFRTFWADQNSDFAALREITGEVKP